MALVYVLGGLRNSTVAHILTPRVQVLFRSCSVDFANYSVQVMPNQYLYQFYEVLCMYLCCGSGHIIGVAQVHLPFRPRQQESGTLRLFI